MGTVLAVGVGGGLGALLRYYVAGLLQPAGALFNWGIFFVNISGGFVMGLIVEGSALRFNLSPELRSFLTVGILGGYTTFSTFSLDAYYLIERGQTLASSIYMVASVALSVGALIAALRLVRALP